MHRCFLPALLAALFLPMLMNAQDPMSVQPGQSASAAVEKARARFDYFYDRATWPNGSIPVGARAKAVEQARETMQLFTRKQGKDAIAAAPVWVNRGPVNIGGRITSIVINPKNPRTIFAAAADGGVWRSFDEGGSWHSVSDDFPTQAVGALAIDPADTAVVYAGTGDPSFGDRSFDGAGLFKSTDGGSTWAQAGSGTLPAYSRFACIAINPANTGVLYAAIPYGNVNTALAGIWKSTDAGATWSLLLTGRMTDILIDPKSPSVMYTVSTKLSAGGSAARYGLLKTTDGGTTWNALSLGVPDSLVGRAGMALCAAQPNVLYLGVAEVQGNPARLMGVFKSTDAGATWKQCDVPLDYTRSQRGTLGWFANIIGVDPVNPDIVFAGSVKLLRSGDGGKTWTRVPDQLAGGPLHVDQHAIAFHPTTPDRVFIGNDGGIFLVKDAGATVIKSDYGLSITQFIGGDMHPFSDRLLLGGTQDNGTLISETTPDFELSLYGDGGHSFVDPLHPNIMYASQEQMKLWRSDDAGRTWSSALGTLPGESSLFYIAWDMDRTNPATLFVSSYNIYRTTDAGRNWRQMKSCIFPTGTGSCYFVTALSVTPYDPRTVLAAAPGSIAISTDAGETWTLKGGLPVASVTSVHSFEPGVIYATIGRYGNPKVWRSTDYGNSWKDLTGNLPDIPVTDLVALDGKLIIGTDVGCFVTEDAGVTWQRFGTGMPAVSVQRFRWSPQMGVLRAITHGRGMFDMQWSTPPAMAPVFTSRPDTAMLEPGQPFVYAPVVTGYPAPSFRLIESPAAATVDSVFGTVRWTGSDMQRRFTLEATNANGTAHQVFTLHTSDVKALPWEVVSSERTATNVNRLAVSPDRTLWMARDTGWVSRSTDRGFTWTHHKVAGDDASTISIAAIDANTAIAGTGGPQALVNTGAGHLWKTTDGGATWRDVLYGIDGRFGNIFFWDAQNGIAVTQGVRDSADVYLTSDAGSTWTRTAQRCYALRPLYGTLTFTDRMNGVFASTNQDIDASNDASVVRTTDGGQTWAARTAGSGIRYVSDIAFVSKDHGWLADENSGRIRRSITSGQSWSATFYPMNGLRNTAVCTDRPSGSIWVISDTSAWVSRDDGQSWMRTQLAPAGPVQDAVFADSLEGWIVSKSGIVQHLYYNPVVAVGRAPRVADNLVLGESFPNPVAGRTERVTIPFTLRSRASVTLKIFNASGKELATLVDGGLPAGEHLAMWDAGAMSSGVYFVSLSSGTQSITRRLVVAR